MIKYEIAQFIPAFIVKAALIISQVTLHRLFKTKVLLLTNWNKFKWRVTFNFQIKLFLYLYKKTE